MKNYYFGISKCDKSKVYMNICLNIYVGYYY